MPTSDTDITRIDPSDDCGAEAVDPNAFYLSVAEPSTLSLRFENETLFAVLTSSADHDADPQPTVTSHTAVKDQLHAENFGDLLFEEGVLDDLVQRINSGETGEFKIGRRVDASFSVLIAKDKLTATIDTTPAWGGKVLSQDGIEEALKEASIDADCRVETAIHQAVELTQNRESVDKLIIARAIPPEPGEDAQFEFLIDLHAGIHPKIDDSGRADLHQLQEFVCVEPGAALMRRTPATSGISGRNVLGEVIAPKAGKNTSFARNTAGSVVDPSDKNILLAKIAGRPVLLPEGVRVEPVLVLDGVNVKSGNIEFDGAVEVRGDVASGFMVKAGGDVQINGTVERARIYCGGSLVVSGGVLGDNTALTAGKESERQVSYLEVGGQLKARFISRTEAQVAGDVEVREYLISSHVTARGEIRLGQSGGNGKIMAGHCHSDVGIRANTLGSDGYVSTSISAGISKRVEARLEKLKSIRSRRLMENQKLTEILDSVRQGKAERVGQVALDKARKIHNTIAAGEAAVEELDTEIAELQQQLDSAEPAFVEVKTHLYPNVLLSIDDASHLFQEEHGGSWLVNCAGNIEGLDGAPANHAH